MNSRNLSALALLSWVCACSEQPCTPPQCDTRSTDCQARVMAATACLRGVKPRTVKTRVIRLDQYVDEEVTAADEYEQARFEQRSKALALLGLEQAESYTTVIGAFAAQVGAYYSPSTDSVTLLERDGQDISVLTLVHEYAHALQHQLLDPEDADKSRTLDESLAYGAMIEGDVTLTTDRAAMLLFGADPEEPNWARVYRQWKTAERSDYADEPFRVSLAGRYFLYAFGAAFLDPVFRTAGQTGIAAWLNNPPQSTRAVIAGAGDARQLDNAAASDYEPEDWAAPIPPRRDASAIEASVTATDGGALSDAGASTGGALSDAASSDAALAQDAAPDPVFTPFTSGLPLLLPQLPELQLITLDSLGAFVFEAYVEQLADAVTSDEVAKDVRGTAPALEADHLSLWRNPANETLTAVYRLRTSNEWAQEALAKAISEVIPARVTLIGDDVVVIASDDSAWLEALNIEALTWLAVDSASVGNDFRASHSALPNGTPQRAVLRALQ